MRASKRNHASILHAKQMTLRACDIISRNTDDFDQMFCSRTPFIRSTEECFDHCPSF